MAADWEPELYRRFEAERTRPAAELLARVQHGNTRFVTDLGCGPGNSTELLRAAFPSARIVGADTSESMLEQARERVPSCEFQLADIGNWEPEQKQDVIYANAALQWLPDHDSLFPRLMRFLTEDGVLAVQMPDNDNEPTHLLMREVALEKPWCDKLRRASGGEQRLSTPQQYYDLLAKESVHVDIWRTIYFQEMPSTQAIIDWFRATRLRPYLTRLNDAEQKLFLERYHRRLEPAYPKRANGNVLLPFPRLFIVARKLLKK